MIINIMKYFGNILVITLSFFKLNKGQESFFSYRSCWSFLFFQFCLPDGVWFCVFRLLLRGGFVAPHAAPPKDDKSNEYKETNDKQEAKSNHFSIVTLLCNANSVFSCSDHVYSRLMISPGFFLTGPVWCHKCIRLSPFCRFRFIKLKCCVVIRDALVRLQGDVRLLTWWRRERTRDDRESYSEGGDG